MDDLLEAGLPDVKQGPAGRGGRRSPWTPRYREAASCSASFVAGIGRAPGSGPGEGEARQDAGSSSAVSAAGVRPCRRAGPRRPAEGLVWPGAGGAAGAGRPWCAPGGDAPAGEHAEPERERLTARVQGGMTELLVAGVQPAAGGGSLAGIPGSGAPGSAAAWPGDGRQGQGRVILLPRLAGGQVRGFWSGAPGGGPARARCRRGCTRTPKASLDRARQGRAGRSPGSATSCWVGPGEDLPR